MRGAVVYGYTTYDSLPDHLRAGATKLGYKSGDQVPTRRYTDDHPDRSISFLKPPAKNLRSANPSDWVRFNP